MVESVVFFSQIIKFMTFQKNESIKRDVIFFYGQMLNLD